MVNLKVGVVSAITEDIWQNVAERLEEIGTNINLEVVLFSGFATANTALVEGDIDLNNFQYAPSCIPLTNSKRKARKFVLFPLP